MQKLPDTTLDILNECSDLISKIFKDDCLDLIKKNCISSCPEMIFFILWRMLGLIGYHTEIIPQYKIKKYKIDFYIPVINTVIEIDSYEFHDRTPDQVTYERKRWRDIESLGFKVIRYSAKEIINNGLELVMEIKNKCRGNK